MSKKTHGLGRKGGKIEVMGACTKDMLCLRSHVLKTLAHLGYFISILLCSAPFATFASAAAKPQRIVSLNLCVDQILIDLVAKDRIAALSFLATDPTLSAVAERAKSYPRLRGEAEAILELNPDLVLVGAYSTPATRLLLQRLGKRVEVVHQPMTLAGIRDLVTHLADLVGAPERGKAMIAAFDKRLQDATALPGGAHVDPLLKKPTALILEVNNIVSSKGSLLDDALTYAGLENTAGHGVAAPGGRVTLETLIAAPPDVLVLANTPDDFKTVLADNLRHPALRAIRKDRPVVTVPMWASLCGTPHVATAVEQFAAARRQAMAMEPGP